MTSKYHLSLPADLNNSHLVREFAKDILTSANVPHAWVHRLILVTDELFMNAVLYGSKNNKDRIEVNFSYSPTVVTFEVVDNGSKKETKITPKKLRELVKCNTHQSALSQSGRGLALITCSWTDNFTIVKNNHGGLTVKAKKYLKNCELPIIQSDFLTKDSHENLISVRVRDIEDLYEDISSGKIHALFEAINNYRGCTFEFDFEGIKFLEHRNFARFVEMYLMIVENGGKVIFTNIQNNIKKLFKNLSLRSII